MANNVVFLEVHSSQCEQEEMFKVEISLESFITYCIYKYCLPTQVKLKFLKTHKIVSNNVMTLHIDDPIQFNEHDQSIPWQVSSCPLPVVVHEDTAISGLCAVARHISKYRTSPQSSFEHTEGLLGFRKNCLQAPNEVSIWTKFCEVDILNTVMDVAKSNIILDIPVNLVRFENHLRKPVRVHNVYKYARDIKKIEVQQQIDTDNKKFERESKTPNEKMRTPKTRKWKSNTKKQIEIDSSIKIEDLNIDHQFSEGPFLTLADLILLPCFYILTKFLGEGVFAAHLPLTLKWSKYLLEMSEMDSLTTLLMGLDLSTFPVNDITVPVTEDVSLYKCDHKRHNPKKRIFTKEEDIENALSALKDGMEFFVSQNEFDSEIDWQSIPDGANPSAGHLPDERMLRKSEQLQNLALAVQSIAREGDIIVDFCSGSGHLGILVAHLLPQCKIILLENKEQSLLRARTRVQDMGLENVFFFQCNLDFFDGHFDIGMALHACGIASDLVLDKCLKANAKFVVCPCCYGSLHATDRLVYPRSEKFKDINIAQYLCIGHAADQTHEESPLTVRGDRCMAVIDSDRGRLAEECGYKVTLTRLKPLACTPKNNLLIGIPIKSLQL